MELYRKEDQRRDAKQPCRGDRSGRDNNRRKGDRDGNRCRDDQHIKDDNGRYPVLQVNLEAIRQNAEVMCQLCGRRGINVAGVIKFSDGDLNIARAYSEGGCKQIASSRTVHLERIKQAMPQVQTMLIRIPMTGEVEDVVRWCDLSLNSEVSILRLLDQAAAEQGKTHGVILMQDVGDRREGIYGREELMKTALLVERELKHLYLAGIGASFACVSGVLPDWDNLSELADRAKTGPARSWNSKTGVSGPELSQLWEARTSATPCSWCPWIRELQWSPAAAITRCWT